MSTEPRPRTKRTWTRLLIFLGVVVVGVAIASAAFAGWTTINTNNAQLDAAWGTANYTRACAPGGLRPADHLAAAWARNDGTNIYFRVTTCASPALSSSTMRAIAAIDCNNNGNYDEPYVAGPDGDRRVVYYQSNGAVWVVDGKNNPVIQEDATNSEAIGADIEWQVPLVNLYTTCRGSTSPINIMWVTADTNSTPATVIDSLPDPSSPGTTATPYFLSNPMDYGDTSDPNSTPPACATPGAGHPMTILACNGPRSGLMPPTPGGQPLRLGSEAVDPDPGNLQNAGSNADDTTPPSIPPGVTPQPTPVGNSPDDEQGIAPSTITWKSTTSATLTFSVVGASQARLNCWIDFNKNGVWTDAGENVVANIAVSVVSTSATIIIPSNLTFPNSFPARCRISPEKAGTTPTPIPPYGPVEFGEVEDHLWQFDVNGLYVPPTPVPTYTPMAISAPAAITNLAAGQSGSNVRLTWTNPPANDSTRLLSNLSNPYFAPAAGTDRGTYPVPTAAWNDPTYLIGDATISTVYYILLGRVGLVESGPSVPVGLFEFGLTPGLP